MKPSVIVECTWDAFDKKSIGISSVDENFIVMRYITALERVKKSSSF